MNNFDKATSFTKFDIYCIVPEPIRVGVSCIFQLTTSADVFHGTCSLIRRAYQRTLADVDLRIHLGGFSCQQCLCIYIFYITVFMITSFFFRSLLSCKSSALTSCLVKGSALQMYRSSSSLLIDAGTGFTSTESRRWYCISF